MASALNDQRLDPRIRDLLAAMPPLPWTDFESRQELLLASNSPEAVAQRAAQEELMAVMDLEDVAPKVGLEFEDLDFLSSPDGNTVKVHFIRPEGHKVLPCVYYIHGGGMQFGSAYDAIYRTWGRIIAHQGVAVAMVDFRNCVIPSSAPEVAPFPAGLNDCVSGLEHVIAEAEDLGIDPQRVTVAGESGGGNLSIATTLKLAQLDRLHLIHGLYSMCPFIAGEWPQDRLPSSSENNGIILDLHNNQGRISYGIEAFEAEDPLAWPLFATEADVADFPKTMISVNECDPLRDEGIEFYRMLLRAAVPAQCREVKGTPHGAELLAIVCPDISYATAASIAHWATS